MFHLDKLITGRRTQAWRGNRVNEMHEKNSGQTAFLFIVRNEEWF